ncbi:MAG: nucleoside deaminase [Anaerolineales bacterium]|nr:nucleoside deaminase [Anaerolineales bacterium]
MPHPDLHQPFLQQTLTLAAQAVTKGNHPFGALLVKDEQVLLTAENTVASGRDVTQHAELNLVSAASQQFDAQTLSQTILYTSTEPCAMCTGAIYWAGIPMIVYACSNGALGALFADQSETLTLSAAEILRHGGRPVKVLGPLLEEPALAQHRHFWLT